VRKILTLLMALILALPLALMDYSSGRGDAQAGQKRLTQNVVFKIDVKEYFVNNQTSGVAMDVAPMVRDGRTYVPIRFLANALGVADKHVGWKSPAVTLAQPGFPRVELAVGQKRIVVDGKAAVIDAAPMVRGGRTMLPARPVAEALGYQVEWDAVNQAVIAWPKGQPKPDIEKVLKSTKRKTATTAGKIAYDWFGISIMNSDGSGQQQLTNLEGRPSWSPGGERIVFNASPYPGMGTHIYVMDADGANLRQLTDLPVRAAHPTWSPCGAKIAFVVGKFLDSNATSIWVMNSDGSGQKQLVDVAGYYEYHPAWSSCGKWIAFFAGKEPWDNKSYKGYLVRPDGTGLRQMAELPGEGVGMAWSPDGQRIIFGVSDRGIFLTEPGGTSLKPLVSLSDLPAGDAAWRRIGNPAWSPCGKWIAFSVRRDRDPNIYIHRIGIDGAGLRLIAVGADPAWSPALP
jgi:hypothetical protein